MPAKSDKNRYYSQKAVEPPAQANSQTTKRAKMFKFDYVLTVVQIAGLKTYSVHTKNCLAHW